LFPRIEIPTTSLIYSLHVCGAVQDSVIAVALVLFSAWNG